MFLIILSYNFGGSDYNVTGRASLYGPPTDCISNSPYGQNFNLITFQNGGTVLEDAQGESAFDPAAVNPPTPPAKCAN